MGATEMFWLSAVMVPAGLAIGAVFHFIFRVVARVFEEFK